MLFRSSVSAGAGSGRRVWPLPPLAIRSRHTKVPDTVLVLTITCIALPQGDRCAYSPKIPCWCRRLLEQKKCSTVGSFRHVVLFLGVVPSRKSRPWRLTLGLSSAYADTAFARHTTVEQWGCSISYFLLARRYPIILNVDSTAASSGSPDYSGSIRTALYLGSSFGSGAPSIW